LFIAGSVLSKGPVSLYVLFLSFAIAYAIALKPKGNLLHFLKLISLLIFGIVLGGWWYMHVRIADPETFAAIAAKETSNWSSYNVRPFYYYWSFFVQSGLWTIPALISLLYPYLKSRVSNLKAYRFSFFWTIIAVILLSIIPEKKSRYLMPVLIPLAFNIGFYIEYLIREFKNLKDKRETFPVYFQFGLIGLIGILFWMSEFFIGSFIFSDYAFRYVITSFVLIIVGVFIFQYLKKKDIKTVFYLCIALMLSLGFFALPLANLNVQDGYKPISELQNIKIDLYHLDYVAPEMIYNYGDKIPSIKADEGYTIPIEKTFHLLTKTEQLDTIEVLSKLYKMEYIDTYDLNRASKDSRAYNKRLTNQLYKLTLK
jgi:hypothetical protein